MGRDRHGSGQGSRKAAGAHRRSRRRRRVIIRTVAAGGAALCVGAAYDLSTPNADALSLLLPGGNGSTTRINILEGNVFNPQLGIGGGSTSNNSTIGNVWMNQGNNIINQLLSTQINLGGSAGNGNTTQINILSYNIFNPQFSIGPNISNNTSVNNVAMGNGNNSTSAVTTPGGALPFFGGAAGNGNTAQFSFFSGNIINPQYSLFGQNLSNNTAITNVAMGNGNYSATSLALGGWLGTFVFGGGNGNTFQYGFFVSNIYNPQFSWGAGNMSNNTAATNTSSGNGNDSTNGVTGGGLGTAVGGVTGNGNSTQVSTGSGNIFNDQINVGPFGGTGTGVSTVSSTNLESTVQQLVADSTVVASDAPVAQSAADAGDTDTAEHRNVQASTLARESDEGSPPVDETSTGDTNNAPIGAQADPAGGDASPVPAAAETGNPPDGATDGDGAGDGGGAGDGSGGDGSA